MNMNKLYIVCVAALLLVACNNNDDDPVAAAPVVQPSADSFTLYVKAELQQTQEDTQPKDIEMVSLVLSDNAEPIAIN